jgi:hypothetical protein
MDLMPSPGTFGGGGVRARTELRKWNRALLTVERSAPVKRVEFDLEV